ncbi:MAG: Carboxy-terminal-processing protease [Candidatus Wolfebacteria bacterium GW2011_GWC2_39_22]|uniref:Carboxy-terminal-processing protease n=1 Tax=Candidatus Wolfebacteria bacterium GW2011_GWC2_39_22 TaxID=1619013 RepID=A0A0G0QR99_9BACT|nr:MAG: Carboxy-terminal-processing protease [Candidatus Wolfebacteria bacterium GW2011_GWC2_39_22]HBI25429.1 S41 family peptidase [Candidatus Wolfebacteria bacterium]
MKKLATRIALAVSIVLIIVLLGGASFSYGYRKGAEQPKLTIVKGVTNLEDGKETTADFSLFWDAWQVMKEKYVDANNVTDQEMVYGAISGMLASTGDPYSVFMPPKEADDFAQEISGEFGGIGAEIGIRNEQLVVVAPLKNTPAERAGIKAGDAIVKINDEDTHGLTTETAVGKIRGEKGTTVTLTLFREGWSDTKDFPIVRDAIQIPTLDWKMVNDAGKEDANGKILYIQLYNFYEKSPLLFYQAVAGAIDKNPKGIILDLRNNPGGYLDASVNIAGWFVDRGSVVVTEKFKADNDGHENFEAQGLPVFRNTPTVVLINQGSASASEILAGALRDNNGAKLVGEKSFGKGSVQELIPLKADAMVKITIAHWLTPNGTVIDKNGLTPDIKVAITEEDVKAEKDPQFDKAVEVLKEQLK